MRKLICSTALVSLFFSASAAADTGAVSIFAECPLVDARGSTHRVAFGFPHAEIDAATGETTRLIDPDGVLQGADVLDVKIGYPMIKGSRHSITFGHDGQPNFELSMDAIETGALNAVLIPDDRPDQAYLSGQCFIIDGQVADYIFKRRLNGDWGNK